MRGNSASTVPSPRSARHAVQGISAARSHRSAENSAGPARAGSSRDAGGDADPSRARCHKHNTRAFIERSGMLQVATRETAWYSAGSSSGRKGHQRSCGRHAANAEGDHDRSSGHGGGKPSMISRMKSLRSQSRRTAPARAGAEQSGPRTVAVLTVDEPKPTSAANDAAVMKSSNQR